MGLLLMSILSVRVFYLIICAAVKAGRVILSAYVGIDIFGDQLKKAFYSLRCAPSLHNRTMSDRRLLITCAWHTEQPVQNCLSLDCATKSAHI